MLSVNTRYDHPDDAIMRLSKTFVKNEGRFGYIRGRREDFDFLLQYPGGTEVLIDVNSEEVDISSPKLGFINSNGRAYYPTLTPVRKQRQGVCLDYLMLHDTLGTNWHYEKLFEANYIETVCLMLENTYPSLEQALQIVSKTKVTKISRHKSCAFSRNLAVTNIGPNKGEFLLNFRSLPCGIIQDQKISLFDNLSRITKNSLLKHLNQGGFNA